jgi:pSer/pThr/pTyr-binding forkhead associated (FHA) protein
MIPPLVLTFMSGPRDGDVVTLAAQGDAAMVTFGRLATCGVSLPDDPDVSRQHARLTWRDGAWWIEDAGSSNGTFLGEFAAASRVITPTRISVGEIFRVGRTRFRLEIPEQQRAAAAAHASVEV